MIFYHPAASSRRIVLRKERVNMSSRSNYSTRPRWFASLMASLFAAGLFMAGSAFALNPPSDPPPDTDPPPDNGVRDPGTGPWQLVSDVAAECNLDPAALRSADRAIGTSYVVVRCGKLCHENIQGLRGDGSDQVYSVTKTLGALTIGALIHQTRNMNRPLGEFDRVDEYLRRFSYHQDATVAHVLAMTAAASSSLDWGRKRFRYD